MKAKLATMFRSIFATCIHIVKKLLFRKKRVVLRNEFFDYYAMYHLS
jgi:hypothetical protein